MSFATAQARCNATALRVLGAGLVQLDGVDVQGDFTAAMKAREVAGMEISATDPMCTVLTADVPADPVGKTLVPDGATTYYVVDLKADGLGFTVLALSLEAP
jgi:hypothetical protein